MRAFQEVDFKGLTERLSHTLYGGDVLLLRKVFQRPTSAAATVAACGALQSVWMNSNRPLKLGALCSHAAFRLTCRWKTLPVHRAAHFR